MKAAFPIFKVLFVVSLVFGQTGVLTLAQSASEDWEAVPLTGETRVHDPSTMHKIGERFFLASTGRGIQTMSSEDLVGWTRGPRVFEEPPQWALDAVPGFRGHIWAPDVILLNGKYYLYYSISTFGKQVSAIGLATNPTLDPDAPEYEWTDHGPVIQSREGSPYNAIDPAILLDDDGRLWMSWGSFWQGIYLIELDPKTGKRIAEDSPEHRLAWSRQIEAPCIYKKNGYYYLFVNWGRCCRGLESTYEIRVGRSREITGPYLDRDGKDLVEAGGSLFLETDGRFIGPGHVGVLVEDGTELFGYHFYDRESEGRSRLAIGRLGWDEEGWPLAVTADGTMGSDSQ